MNRKNIVVTLVCIFGLLSVACGSDSAGDGNAVCEDGETSFSPEGVTECCCESGNPYEWSCVDGQWTCNSMALTPGDCSECETPGPLPDTHNSPVDIQEEEDVPVGTDEAVAVDVGSDLDTAVSTDSGTSTDTVVPEDIADPVDAPAVEDLQVSTDEGSTDEGPGLPELFLGNPVDVAGTEGMTSMSSWLYGMAVNHEHRVSIAWGGKPLGSSDMKLYISQSNGVVDAFGDPIVIDESIPSDNDDRKADIDTVGTDHLILWKDSEGDSNVIRFRRSSEPDFSGEDVVVFSDNPGVQNFRPYMVRSPDGQNIWAIWQREQSVVVVSSTDGGATFSGPIPTVVQPTNIEAFTSAAVLTPAGALVVCYHGRQLGLGLGENTIYCQSSDNGGQSFDAPVDVGAISGFDGNHGHPSMALGQDNRVHVVWTFNNGQNALKSSSEDGIEWAPATDLDPVKWMPMVRTGREALLHISGFDNTGGIGAPVYATSPDDGQTLGAPAYLPTTPGSMVPRHDMVANLTMGYLYICWWEWGNQSKMRVIGIDPYAQ